MLRFRCLPLLLHNSGVFSDCGRALRCLLPVASGRFLHLVVLYGYQGADGDAERLSLTDQLLDAALGELRVVAFGPALSYRWGFQRGAHQNPLPV